MRVVWLCLFVACVVLANAITSHFGLVPVGFGLTATAGTYAAGLALVTRDYLQEAAGLAWVVAGILAGAALSWWLAAPAIAVASGVAFLASETADALVYTPLRRSTRAGAILASSLIGAAIDTLIFVGLAFGAAAITPQVFAGQMLVKVVYVALPVAAFAAWRVRALSVR